MFLFLFKKSIVSLYHISLFSSIAKLLALLTDKKISRLIGRLNFIGDYYEKVLGV